jgi:hypothetical protein
LRENSEDINTQGDIMLYLLKQGNDDNV